MNLSLGLLDGTRLLVYAWRGKGIWVENCSFNYCLHFVAFLLKLITRLHCSLDGNKNN